MKGRRILLGITGSIAAYKCCDLVSQLVKLGHEVRVIMTPNAEHFVTPLSLATLCRHPVYQHAFTSSPTGTTTEHIALARWAEIVCIAPASADFLCKHAAGIADNLLLTELLAYTGTIIMAPAMNTTMWNSFQVQAAVLRLQSAGVNFIAPATGDLACGEYGVGKMAAVESIVDALVKALAPATLLQGKHFLLTAGATRSYLDPVRFISNPSTGQMGFALAKAIEALGGSAHIVAGVVDSTLDFHSVTSTQTASEMLKAVMQHLPKADGFISVAAVNDYGFATSHPQKFKKGEAQMQVTLVREPDILETVARSEYRPALVVGFAAETEALADNAKAKLQRKQLDYIVLNSIANHQGFGDQPTEVTVFAANGASFNLGPMPKSQLAKPLLEWIHADHQNRSRHKAVSPSPSA